jgi:hypothetical protein
VVGSDGTMCPATPCEPGGSNIKKRLAGLPVQLGTHVPNVHMHVFKASDIRAIMGLQDVQSGNVVNACKACKHASTV